MSTLHLPLMTRHPIALAWPSVLALAVAMGIGRFAFTPVWPVMANDAGLSLAQGGALASANYIGYLLGAIAAVIWPIRRLRSVLIASLLAVAASTLAMALTQHLVVWGALRLIAGYVSASAFICVAASRPVPAGHPQERAVAALTFAGVGAGIALTGLACLVLMSAHASAAQCWLALGALALVLTLLIWPALPTGTASPAAAPIAATPSTASVHAQRQTRRLALHYGIFGIGYIVPATFLPAMARDVIADPAVFGWIWPIFGMAAAVSCLLAPWLARGRDELQIWRAAQLIMAVGMATVALWHSIASVALAALLVGGTFMVITQTGIVAIRKLAGPNAPRAAAAMTAAFATGQILGPLLAAWAAEHGIGLPEVLGASAALLAVSAWRVGRSDDRAIQRDCA